MKSSARILVVSGTNQRFWSHLGCWWQNVTTFLLSNYPSGCSGRINNKRNEEYPMPFLMGVSPPVLQMSNGKWRSDGVKSSHHYNLENSNIFQVKKESSFSFGTRKSTQSSSKFKVKCGQANKKLAKCYSLLLVYRRLRRFKSLTSKADNNFLSIS